MVITGASAGIGRALAVAFAREGARLVLSARRRAVLETVAAQCRSAGAPDAAVVVADVADSAQVQALVDAAVERAGRIDVMVNNAGYGIFGRFEDASDADLARLMGVNVNGTLFGCRAVIPVMRRQGGGHIINVASVAGLVGLGGMAAYCATKFAQVGLSQGLRTELRGDNIWVTAVLPVATRTEFFDAAQRTSGVADIRRTWPVHTAEKVARRVVRRSRRRRPPGQIIMFYPFRWSILPIWIFPRLADFLPLRVPFAKPPAGDD